jgi:hypothetical protein
MPTLHSFSLAVRRWRQFLANRGVVATASTIAGSILRRLRPSATAGESASELWRNADQAPVSLHPFDTEHGTDTSGLIWGENLRSGHRHDTWNTAYYGIAPSVFKRAIELVGKRAALDWSRFTFIDMGSGKGRAVLLASRESFARVLGVELSPELHRVATSNLKLLLPEEADAAHVTMLQADAADFPWSQALKGEVLTGPLLFFLYNPFSKPVLEKFLKQLEASFKSSAREVYFLFINPELDAVMLRQTWIEKLWQETMTIGAADQAADRFGSTTETVAAYRVRLQR